MGEQIVQTYDRMSTVRIQTPDWHVQDYRKAVWSTSPVQKGEETQLGGEVLMDTAKTLYMRWQDIRDHLCFTADGGQATVGMVTEGTLPPSINLEYSTDRVHWQQFQPGTTSVSLSAAGVSVWFRAGSGGNTHFAVGYDTEVVDPETGEKSVETVWHRHGFVFTGAVRASGSVMSLLDASGTVPIQRDRAFAMLFRQCGALMTSPALPATQLTYECYHEMFYGCQQLQSVPALPAQVLAEACYHSMFSGCSALTAVPSGYLHSQRLAENCYMRMFMNCTSLTSAPPLPADDLIKGCYYGMFSGCSALTSPPVLNAWEMQEKCYAYMFQDCTSLVSPPTLDSNKLAPYCYMGMFKGCSALTSPPALPATALYKYCYSYMFTGCTSLHAGPVLPAESLENASYYRMFTDCSQLNSLDVSFTAFAGSSTIQWLNGVSSSGTFRCPAGISIRDRGPDTVPVGWTISPK